MYIFPEIKLIKNLYPQLIEVAQEEYDKWDQDESGYDDEYGSGGICHLIADKMVNIIQNELPNVFATTKALSYVQHVNVLIALDDGIYELDLPYNRYEIGGGFTWKKIPDVIFDIDDLVLDRIDINLENAYLYLENNEEILYDGDEDSNELETYIQSVIKHKNKQKVVINNTIER